MKQIESRAILHGYTPVWSTEDQKCFRGIFYHMLIVPAEFAYGITESLGFRNIIMSGIYIH
jgi:hypothetical protein